MRYSTKLSDCVHILALIALDTLEGLSSDTLAASIQTHPAFVRQLMQRLRRAGLMTSVKGHARPALTRPPEQITLLDIYRAAEGDKQLLHMDTHTNPACGVGVNIQLALRDAYDGIQQAAEEAMQRVTLADILASYHTRVAQGKAEDALLCQIPAEDAPSDA